MAKKILVNNQKITLSDKEYLASGGEGEIFVRGATAYKLYHNPQKAIPEQKIRELQIISDNHVVVPQDMIFEPSSGQPIGFTVKFVNDVYPLIRFFAKIFKDQNGIDAKMIAELVKQMQLITINIHSSRCLIVDYNELNVLVRMDGKLTPFYIDVDSYATQSFRATAVMDSIRDRKASIIDGNGILHYNPTIESDWFSWGILVFWLYSNMHVFRGGHPKYLPKDKSKQMDDGVSVFHPGVRMLPTTNPLTVIPKRHLDWMKDTFHDGHRSVPPMPDSTAPVTVAPAIVVIQGSKDLFVKEMAAFPEALTHCIRAQGRSFYFGKKASYSHLQNPLHQNGNSKKMAACLSLDGTGVIASLVGGQVLFHKEYKQELIASTDSLGMFARNNAIYTVSNGKLVENTFCSLGGRVVHKSKDIENVSIHASIYEGCIIQDLLGKKYLTIPYMLGAGFSKHIPQLDGHRIIDAKSEKHVTVVITEKGGKFYRFIIVFNAATEFTVREVADISYDGINFAVSEAGICLLLASPTELEVFVNNTGYQVISDPPFDASMPLFATPGGFYFINGNSIYSVSKQKI